MQLAANLVMAAPVILDLNGLIDTEIFAVQPARRIDVRQGSRQRRGTLSIEQIQQNSSTVSIGRQNICGAGGGRTMSKFAALIAGLGLLSPSLAAAQTIADPAAGEKLALTVCAECHFVAENQPLIPRADAPPFDEIAADPSVSEIGLRVFFQTPHRSMPDLQLSQQETDDIIGFILQLKVRAGGND